jgi:signal peptide peptidase SppA
MDDDLIWAGTEASLNAWREAQERGKLLANTPGKDDDRESAPRLLSVRGGVGLVRISGPLTCEDSWLNALFGITSYNDIRSALSAAAADPDVKSILLDVDSGGGSVNGCMDTATFVRTIDKKIKPVVTYSGGTMASAAYWIGAAARKVFAGPTAVLGSIGVLSTHVDRSKMNEKEGVKVTVLRAGKYKALANPFEPLSDAARESVQSRLDATYDVFLDQVAAYRGQTKSFVDSRMAQGREFVGKDAVTVHLADGICSFDTIFANLLRKSLDKTEGTKQTLFHANKNPDCKGSSMSIENQKKGLSDIELATLSAMAEIGASFVPPAADASAGNPTDQTAPVTPTAAALTPEPGETPEVPTEPVAASTPTPVPAPAQTPDTSTLALLQSQLADSGKALLDARVELAQLKASLESAQATASAFADIVAASANNMSVALGGTPLSLGTAPHDYLLAEHKRLSAAFSSKFKAGGVAAPDVTEAAEPKIDPLHFARMNAVRRAKQPA